MWFKPKIRIIIDIYSDTSGHIDIKLPKENKLRTMIGPFSIFAFTNFGKLLQESVYRLMNKKAPTYANMFNFTQPQEDKVVVPANAVWKQWNKQG